MSNNFSLAVRLYNNNVATLLLLVMGSETPLVLQGKLPTSVKPSCGPYHSVGYFSYACTGIFTSSKEISIRPHQRISGKVSPLH